MLKTLQIAGSHPYGGGGYLLERWCRYLLEKGCSVDVVRTDPLAVAKLKEIRGLRVVEDISIPWEIAPLKDLQALAQLLRRMRRERYDVVHTYNATPGFLGRIAGRLTGVPVILHHQAGWTVDHSSSLARRMLYTPLEYLGTLASTKGICVSHAIAEQASQLRTAPRSKLVTICNGIEPEPFIRAAGSETRRSLLLELNIPEDYLVIGNTARLVADKDNRSLIRAMQILQSLLTDVPSLLLLAGDGPELKELEGLADSLGVAERVRFLGFFRDIPRFLAALNIFVSPSLREGLSISLLEAMAAGRPIITTSIPQNTELIEHETTGLLVPEREPVKIAEAIARFAKEHELAQRCASAARDRVVDRYSIDRMFRETWDLYLSLIECEGPREANSPLGT